MRRYVLIGVAVAMLATALAGAAACGDDDDTNDATVAQPNQVRATSRTASMLAALYISDNAGLHGMDEELHKPGATVNARWLGTVQHAHTAVASVEWPEEIKSKAVSFQDAAKRLADAIARDDATAAAQPAKDAHDTQHDLSREGWAYLAKEATVTLVTPVPTAARTATGPATAAR